MEWMPGPLAIMARVVPAAFMWSMSALLEMSRRLIDVDWVRKLNWRMLLHSIYL